MLPNRIRRCGESTRRGVLNTFGNSPRQPLPNGHGSVTAAMISRGLLSRDLQKL